MADIDYHHFLHGEDQSELPPADIPTEPHIQMKCEKNEDEEPRLVLPGLDDEISKVLAIESLLNQFSHPQVRADLTNGCFGLEININLLPALDSLRLSVFPRWCGGGLANYHSAGIEAAHHINQLMENSEEPFIFCNKDDKAAISYKEWYSTLEQIAASDYWDRVPPETRCTLIILSNDEKKETKQTKRILKKIINTKVIPTKSKVLPTKRKFKRKVSMTRKPITPKKIQIISSSDDSMSVDDFVSDMMDTVDSTDEDMPLENYKSTRNRSTKCKMPRLKPLNGDTDKCKCDECGKILTSKYVLKSHIKTVHRKERNFNCEECKRVFYRKDHLNNHVISVHKKEKNFKCDKCDKVFSIKAILMRHVDAVHKQIFRCEECNKLFASKEYLKTHVNTVHRKEKNFMCDECSRVFSQKTHLNMHITTIHRKERNFKCEECGKDFSTKANLAIHFNGVHKKEKNFKCGECNKAFSMQTNLKRHVDDIHKRCKNYQCDECGKIFSRNDNLRSHIDAVHKKLKNFKCDRCSQDFFYKADFLKHIDAVHGCGGYNGPPPIISQAPQLPQVSQVVQVAQVAQVAQIAHVAGMNYWQG